MLSRSFQRCLLLSKEIASTSVLKEFPKILSTSTCLGSDTDRKEEVVHKEEIQGDDIQAPRVSGAFKRFPTLETFSQLFNGIPFSQLPIIHIKATSNNTIISATDSDGVVFAIKSAGSVGFKNAKRGTNVAAQAAAIAIADDIVRKDVKTARVCLKGIGPGRLPALKALQLSGIDVVSITDTTPLPHNGNRPKKVRRL